MFKGSIGFHFALHVLNRYSLPDLLDLTGEAVTALDNFNFKRVWVNDNLEYRNLIVAAAALVSRYDIQIGTAIAVPYIRNPIDLASAIASLSELHPGRRIGLGIGAGSESVTGQKIELIGHLAVAEEMARFLRELFNGNEANVKDYPFLSSYFHLKADSFKLRFPSKAEVDLHYGFSGLGAKTTLMIARLFDGIIVQTRLLEIPEMEQMTANLDEARARAGVEKRLRKVLMLNASVSRDAGAAMEGGKRFVSHIVSSTPSELLKRRGILPEERLNLEEKFSKNQGLGVAAGLTSDSLVKRVLVAGTPKEVLEKVSSLFKFAEKFGFEEVMIGPPLGPDPAEVIDIWAKEILPSVL
ncbi:MAG: LLM class flavin-dependent oxidoreductase [Nitrososphaerales archaeon]